MLQPYLTSRHLELKGVTIHWDPRRPFGGSNPITKKSDRQDMHQDGIPRNLDFRNGRFSGLKCQDET